jgi:hypothetical protein
MKVGEKMMRGSDCFSKTSVGGFWYSQLLSRHIEDIVFPHFALRSSYNYASSVFELMTAIDVNHTHG